MKNFHTKRKKISVFLSGIIFFWVVLSANFPDSPRVFAAALPKPIKDPMGVEANTGEQTQIELWKLTKEEKEKRLLDALRLAYRKALNYFLKTFAIDVATYLASGGEGQKPLFYTEGWGAYIARTADNAAGHFINQFARGLGAENICTLNFRARFAITLGLKQARKPEKPQCSFTEMLQNWERDVSDPNKFLSGMDAYFSPNQNDLGAAFLVHSSLTRTIERDTDDLIKEREEGEGFKALKDKISGFIQTPAKTISGVQQVALDDLSASEKQFLGSIAADTIDTFVTTLAGKFLQRMFQKGLAAKSSLGKEDKFNWDDIDAVLTPEASPLRGSQDEARAEFAAFISPRVSIGNPTSNRLDVTVELLNDDVINSRFKTAIDRKLTIEQAISEGLLSVNGAGSTFGFTALNQQPTTREGYSYNSLVILRKYRILPVGWELAAAYIQKNFQDRILSLGDVIKEYNNPSSPFYHLIDTNWVLKAPDTYCRLEGPGEELALSDWSTEKIIDETRTPAKEYEFNRQTVSRQDSCADSQSCIYEDGNGNCLYYGYCTEERPLWRMNGETCPAEYNSCQKFVNEDNDSFSFLSDTLNARDCSPDRVGCQWYCADYNRKDNLWTCLAQEERVIKPCDNPNGCPVVDSKTGETCTIPNESVSCTIPSCRRENNLVVNPGFEREGATARTADGWDTRGENRIIERVSGKSEKVYSGNYSLKMSYFGGLQKRFFALSSPIVVVPKGGGNAVAYTLTARIFNSLTYGRAYAAITDSTGAPIADEKGCQTSTDMDKGKWNIVNCTFSLENAVETTVYVGLILEDENYPVGSVWFDDIDVQPACPSRDVVVYMNAEDSVDESKIFFDQEVRECSQTDAGCSEFIRTKDGLGTNMIINGSFEDWSDGASPPTGWLELSAGTQKFTDKAAHGANFARFSENASLGFLIPFPLEPDKNYILSLYGKNVPGKTASLSVKIDYVLNNANRADLVVPFRTLSFSDSWKRVVSAPFHPPVGRDYRIVVTEAPGSESDIDALLLEEVPARVVSASPYVEYGSKNKVYLKKPPDYLECTGNPETDHSACQNYALKCSRDEVGCEAYTPSNGDPVVPGIVTEFDRCPAACVGYDAFRQSATNFEQEKFPVYLIPKTGEKCQSSQAGCSEFTNLDEVKRGGEGKEYYKYLRQCIKPDNSCKSFYTWIGSDVSGYQLKVYSLRDVNGDDKPDEIANPRRDLGDCGNAKDASENPNCREFYSSRAADLEASYALLQNTVSCSDSCAPFRMTGAEKSDCESSGGVWGVCKGTAGGNISDPAGCAKLGGFIMPGSEECWTRELEDPVKNLKGCNTDIGVPGFTTTFEPRNQCVYMAVPQEGEKCSSQNASCREYRGNASANVRVVFFDNFESGAPVQWKEGEISSEALAVGGHSLKSETLGATNLVETFSYKLAGNQVCAPIISSDPAIPNNPDGLVSCSPQNSVNCWNAQSRSCALGTSPAQKCTAKLGENTCGVLDSALAGGASYLVSFWAKSASPGSKNIDVTLSTKAEKIDTVTAREDWQEYLVGPIDLAESEAQAGAALKFSSAGAVVYDSIALKITNEYNYLIKNSWTTPVECDTNPYTDPPSPAPQFMLGCKEYQTSAGKKVNLKSFDRLCRESAIGCEALIDTQNTNSPYPQSFQEQNPQARIDIPADSISYYANSPSRACGAPAKGCRALGEPEFSQDAVLGYATKYLLNDPQKYDAILCNEDNVGCQRYVSEEEGVVYMKDPKSRTCEYRQIPGASSYGWFQSGSKSVFPDCPTALNSLGIQQPGKSCFGGDVSGSPCQSDEECLGGGKCLEWAGMCPEETAGCTAYVDPQSTIQPGILSNGNFEGYNKICSQSRSPCVSQDQCPQGETCGPQTRVTQWISSSSDLVVHSRFGGFGSSSGVEFTGTDTALTLSQGKTVSKGILYTVSARSKETSLDAQVKITSSSLQTLKHFDNSVQINSDGDTVVLPIVNESGDYKIFAGRFFVADEDAGVSIVLKATRGKFDDVEIKNTGIYYYLASDVDKRSCSATVNPELGCVLFNDTSEDVLSFASLESKPGSPAAVCTGIGCDSNAVLKVTPDRDCGKWLECVSAREQLNTKTGKKEVFCQQIAECSALNPVNGQCMSFPPPVQTAQEYNPGNVDFIKNITGYSKVGFRWDENTSVEGYFPYGAMEQKKICVEPSEKFGASCIEDEDCQSGPGTGDGVCQPILQVREDKTVYESCRVYPESGSPRWGDGGPNDTGDKPSANVIVDIQNPLGKKNWKNIDSVNQKILSNAAECSYKKDESLFQGIYGFCVEKDPRSPYLCLNWLPVDEITGGWVGVSGWADNIRDSVFYCTEGAALEYRKSARESKCYQSDFWGVENMFDFGASIDPGQTAVESPQCGKLLCPPGYEGVISTKKCGSFFRPGQRCEWECIPKAEGYKFTDSNNIAWYDYVDKLDKDSNFTKKHIMYCPGCTADGKVIYDPEEPGEKEPRGWLRVCDALTKVTDDDGDNRAWKRRVEAILQFNDSGYRVPDYNYTIDVLTRPFGSLGKQWKGDAASWPYLTDTVDALKYDRPYFDYFDNEGNVGQIYHDVFSKINPVPNATNARGGRERVKRLFAQNFGTWQWTGTNYQKLNSTDSRCVGGPDDSKSCNLLDVNACKDAGRSVCTASPGYCEYYYSLADSKVRTADPKSGFVCTDAPGDPSPQCESFVFCAAKFCQGPSVDTSTFQPCRDSSECSGGEECKEPREKLGYCEDDKTQSCTENSQCKGGTCTKAAGAGYCSAGLKAGQACGGGSDNPDCNVPDSSSRCVGLCSAVSERSGRECRSSAECQVDGVCTDFSYWIPPKDKLCPLNIRPNYFTEKPEDPADPLAPGDWCGIAPEVYNFNIQGSLKTPYEVYGGSGEVTLSFNIKVDDNQLPLKELIIDWGDDQPQTLTSPRFGLKDKPDVKDPFVFPHIYTYDKPYDSGCRQNPNNPESCDGYSDYKIHILAKDNWGWCTCKDLGVCKSASSADGDCENQLSDQNPTWQELDTSNSWIGVPVIIRVYSTAKPSG